MSSREKERRAPSMLRARQLYLNPLTLFAKISEGFIYSVHTFFRGGGVGCGARVAALVAALVAAAVAPVVAVAPLTGALVFAGAGRRRGRGRKANRV
jgi:hypothetical protein